MNSKYIYSLGVAIFSFVRVFSAFVRFFVMLSSFFKLFTRIWKWFVPFVNAVSALFFASLSFIYHSWMLFSLSCNYW